MKVASISLAVLLVARLARLPRGRPRSSVASRPSPVRAELRGEKRLCCCTRSRSWVSTFIALIAFAAARDSTEARRITAHVAPGAQPTTVAP